MKMSERSITTSNCNRRYPLFYKSLFRFTINCWKLVTLDYIIFGCSYNDWWLRSGATRPIAHWGLPRSTPWITNVGAVGHTNTPVYNAPQSEHGSCIKILSVFLKCINSMRNFQFDDWMYLMLNGRAKQTGHWPVLLNKLKLWISGNNSFHNYL